ncbi:MAG TPA: GNAT family N-acetyltransferase [Candidatus Saccharimonadales bacterium]|nr:GNAT family N-acetyltransferase [Candidatus Saccharimonadales bacterium]
MKRRGQVKSEPDFCQGEDSHALGVLRVQQVASIGAYAVFGNRKRQLKKFVKDSGYIEDTLAAWRSAEHRIAVLAAGRVVGFGMSQTVAAGEAAIMRMYVHPEFQNRKIGRDLLALLEAPFAGRRITVVTTQGTGAEKFYANGGYEPSGEPQPTPTRPLEYGVYLPQVQYVKQAVMQEKVVEFTTD